MSGQSAPRPLDAESIQNGLEWAAQTISTLARQLPGPSVPTRIFLVENFDMMPVSGKIDRERLPDLSQLLTNVDAPAGDDFGDLSAVTSVGTETNVDVD